MVDVDFSPLTYVTMISAMAVVPAYLYWTYHVAGASWRKCLFLTCVMTTYGALMTAFVVEWQFSWDAEFVVPAVMLTSLAIPPTVVLVWPDYFVPEGMSLPWLVGVQAFRVIGGFYLIEYARGNVGPEFAYWAGIGDVLTGVAASALLIQFWWTKQPMAPRAVFAMIAFGLADFAWAYTIGVLSFDTSMRVFSKDDLHATNRFPIAMIPFFLAPVAMAFMVMTLLKLRSDRKRNGDHDAVRDRDLEMEA